VWGEENGERTTEADGDGDGVRILDDPNTDATASSTCPSHLSPLSSAALTVTILANPFNFGTFFPSGLISSLLSTGSPTVAKWSSRREGVLCPEVSSNAS
jgi:hypothetical protein